MPGCKVGGDFGKRDVTGGMGSKAPKYVASVGAIAVVRVCTSHLGSWTLVEGVAGLVQAIERGCRAFEWAFRASEFRTSRGRGNRFKQGPLFQKADFEAPLRQPK